MTQGTGSEPSERLATDPVAREFDVIQRTGASQASDWSIDLVDRRSLPIDVPAERELFACVTRRCTDGTCHHYQREGGAWTSS